MNTPSFFRTIIMVFIFIITGTSVKAFRPLGDTSKRPQFSKNAVVQVDTAGKTYKIKTDSGYVTVTTGKPVPSKTSWNVGEYSTQQNLWQNKETRNLLIKIGFIALFAIYGLFKLVKRLF